MSSPSVAKLAWTEASEVCRRSVRRLRPRPRPRHGSPRLRKTVLVLLAVVVAVTVALATPAIREELKQSFSPVPAAYTELYFTSDPVVRGDSVLVPVSVDDHGPGERTHRLRVSVEASDGSTTASTTTALTPGPDAPASAVSRLPLQDGSVIVRVALLDSGQSLHYRLPAEGAPAPGSTP
ncbi:hypothetical protein ACF09C_02100 [Streptomyces sp. NPDC014870]|uniref:hypothetical protein n=1 Tax=Streptomyces sp. NPDC014870 TaxID=3364925 RepID=UPI0036FD2EB6